MIHIIIAILAFLGGLAIWMFGDLTGLWHTSSRYDVQDFFMGYVILVMCAWMILPFFVTINYEIDE